MGGRNTCLKSTPFLEPVRYILQLWTWHTYISPKENPKKCINHVTHPLSSADIIIFLPEFANFTLLKNIDKDCILMHNV